MNVTELQISWAAARYVQHATVQAPNLSQVFATRSGHVILPITWPIQNGGPQPAVGPRREFRSQLQVNISRHPLQKLRYHEAMARKPPLANGDNLHVVRYVNGGKPLVVTKPVQIALRKCKKLWSILRQYHICWMLSVNYVFTWYMLHRRTPITENIFAGCMYSWYSKCTLLFMRYAGVNVHHLFYSIIAIITQNAGAWLREYNLRDLHVIAVMNGQPKQKP